MADNETSYLPIGTCLEQIEKAVYGREVRKAIHDGIAQCYDDTVEGVNAAQQAASDTQDVIDNAVAATNAANTAATEASNVKVEQTVSGDTVTFTTTKRDGTTVSTSFQKPNIVVSKDEGSGEFSVTTKGWNGEEIVAKIPDPSEEVKSRATIAAVSKVKTALGNPLTITDGMDAPAVKTVVTLEPKQDLHGYGHPWVGGSGTNLFDGEWETGEISATTGENSNNSSVRRTVNYISIQPNTEYRIVCSGASGTVRARFYKADKTYIGTISASGGSIEFNAVFVSPAEAYFARFAPNGDNIQYIDGFALNYPSSVTTYAPYSNICPIEGYDTVRVTAHGKNLFPAQRTYTSGVRDDSGNLVANALSRHTMPIYGFLPKTTYAISGTRVVGGTGYRIYYLDKKAAWISRSAVLFSNNDTFTTPADCYAIQLQAHVDLDLSDIQIELGSATTSYTPPSSLTSLSVAQAAGATVYGGTVTLNEDGSGTLVVDRGYVDLGSLTWTKNESSGNTFYQAGDVGATIKRPAATDVVIPLVSDLFNATYAGASFYHYAEGISVHTNGTLRLYYASQPATESELKTFLNGHQLVYPLATVSTSYPLTADQLRTLTGENHVWTDGTKLELTYRADKYADVEKFLNAIPTGTKTGDPAVFTDGADDLPFEKLTIAVEPYQEGTGDPSPTNVRPITGWDEVKVTRTGKNLLENHYKVGQVTEKGITWTVNKDGSVVINGTSTGNTYLYLTETGGMTLKPGTYTRFLGSDKSFSGIRLNCRIGSAAGADAFGIAPDAQTATISEDTVIIVRLSVPSGNTYSNITVYPMIVSGTYTTATFPAWEPYASTTLPISLKYATGSTVYGGTVTINRDGTGSVVVDRAYIEMSGFQYESGATRFWYANVPSPYGATVSRTGSFVCDKYIAVTDGRAISGVTTGMCYFGAQKSNGNCDFYVHDTRYTDATTFNAAVGPVSIAYKLSTPTTYTITAPQLTSLLGNNTVWCDAGQVTVKYKRDIGKALSAIEAVLISNGLMTEPT